MSKLAKALTAAAGNAGGESLYVEDVFSTYLYTGNDSTQTITNGIDLDGEGGLVWTKQRNIDPYNHMLVDTEQGLGYLLESNTTDAAGSFQHISVNSDGYNILGGYGGFNQNPYNYASWTFRKAEKFFDVVTYTGDGTSNRQIPHNINGTVGFILIKRTDSTGNWLAWHKEVNPGYGILDTTLAFTAGSNGFFDAVTDTYFETSWLNTSGATYVAYLFASDAGGFGDDGSESIIKCGSYTGTGGELNVSLGFEPQYIVLKRATGGSSDWLIFDAMRGVVTGGNDERLEANDSAAANSLNPFVEFNADGFRIPSSAIFGVNGSDYIYIAIRRPMKTPESGTEVFNSLAYTGDGASTRDFDLGITTDAYFQACRSSSSYDFKNFTSRLTAKGLYTAGTGTEFITNTSLDVQEGLRAIGFENTLNQSGETYIINAFKRATGFFDVVAYTGTGVAGRTVAHNLGVAPELMIVKSRSNTDNWAVYDSFNTATHFMNLELPDPSYNNSSRWNGVEPTSEVFTVGTHDTNLSGYTYIGYLFASVAGVSKVGSYTGTGSTPLNVDCGFSNGARFVLIKRVDGTGGWYVLDSARGIVAGNDPLLQLNSTAAEVTTNDYIDPYSSGFTVSNTFTGFNSSGSTYIFLAIA